jgi:hypothetical protein
MILQMQPSAGLFQSNPVLEQLSRSIVPVVSEHADMPEFRYSIGGTAFLVRYQDLLCVITAKHVIQNYHSDPHRIRIRTVADGTTFLPFKNVAVSKEESAHGDIAIIEVDQQLMDQSLKSEVCPILLDKFSPFNDFAKGQSLL